MDNRPIGVFDSGVGGLTVASEIIHALPNEDIIYFGDTARVPYGAKSKEVITKYSKQIVNFLLERDVKMIVIACGTASTNSYEELVEAFDIPIVEMVSNGCKSAAAETVNKKVGVIATEASIRSGAYGKALHALDSGIEVFQKSCPLFVPLAEEGWTQNSVAQSVAEIYLQEMRDHDVDTLILGCTHYPLLKECISRVMGGVSLIDLGQASAVWVRNFLKENGMEHSHNPSPEHKFFVSDNTQKFNKICRMVFSRQYDAEISEIDKYQD